MNDLSDEELFELYNICVNSYKLESQLKYEKENKIKIEEELIIKNKLIKQCGLLTDEEIYTNLSLKVFDDATEGLLAYISEPMTRDMDLAILL